MQNQIQFPSKEFLNFGLPRILHRVWGTSFSTTLCILIHAISSDVQARSPDPPPCDLGSKVGQAWGLLG